MLMRVPGSALCDAGAQSRMQRDRLRGHRAFRIQQMVVARPQPQADQSARIGHGFRLPAMVSLIAAHSIFAGLVPGSGRFAAQIMLADQRFLNRLRPLADRSSAGPVRSLFFLPFLCATVERFALLLWVAAEVFDLSSV